MYDIGDGQLVTPDHHFWGGDSWIPANQLFEDAVSFHGKVYNLEVEGEHNYRLAMGLYAHNTLK